MVNEQEAVVCRCTCTVLDGSLLSRREALYPTDSADLGPDATLKEGWRISQRPTCGNLTASDIGTVEGIYQVPETSFPNAR